MTEHNKLWTGEGTVLLIDDEDMIRLISGKMLERMGFKVLTAASGQEGIELYREHGKQIVLVILDLSMPVMTGAEVFRALREIDASARIALSSGGGEEEHATTVTELGANGFITKPYEMYSLNAQLRVLIESP